MGAQIGVGGSCAIQPDPASNIVVYRSDPYDRLQACVYQPSLISREFGVKGSHEQRPSSISGRHLQIPFPSITRIPPVPSRPSHQRKLGTL
ncbi:uncharacterized protein BJ212DRAFT_763605 [Suillus subaureus]|uniref:Uncharacterized protein n=1 Tax=Suillus subaureus TaxID=48587 RepID=A0A9P7AQP3_9AGAM|nr:uncharacterized protein BJ212DRAFT_763605 [Suillus subaureus]KAG1793387.1 hypothetical protein BJ212DRAFT_763605 [Suillus subaureus]